MNKKALLTATLLLGLTAAASAAPKITAQSIIVNPYQGNLNLQVWTNRDQGGQGNPRYAIGEKLSVAVKATQDAYVYLFNVNADGQIDLFFPNSYEGNNFVKAGVTKRFPGQNGKYSLSVGGPEGQDKLLALASRTKLNIDQIASFAGSQGFAQVGLSGQDNLAQALSIVVSPLPQEGWVTDTAYFYVGNGQDGYAPYPFGQQDGQTAYVEPVQPQPVQPAPVQPQPVQPQPVQPAPVSQPVSQIQPGERSDHSFDTAIQDAFSRTKGNESLGQATTYVGRWGTGVWQKFAGVAAYGDAVVLHADGSSRAYAVHGSILKRYLALALAENGTTRPPSRLGWAAGDEKIITRNTFGTTGLYGYFQNGALYFSEKHGTFWLVGDLLKKYQGLGGSGSFLGFPVRDQYLSGGQWAGDFEGGSIRFVGGKYQVYRK
ncbi:DUF4384 domain-containing protein [Deinococcus sp. UYEF24]